MRKASTVWTIAILTLTMVYGTAGRAQDTAPAKPKRRQRPHPGLRLRETSPRLPPRLLGERTGGREEN